MFIPLNRLQKGRGAISNPTGRFEKNQISPIQDLDTFDEQDNALWQGQEEIAVPIETVLHAENSRSIISKNDSPDIGFEQSVNPYKGCEHGCIYCFARPTHEYLGYSAGLDFETQIWYKPNAPQLLEVAFRKKNYQCKPIVLGSNTDPYQPVERKLGLTRQILEVLRSFHHPVSIITKSSLILRDTAILVEMAKKNLVTVCISMTSLDAKLARMLEPRAASPKRRIEVIKILSQAGIPMVVLTSPMIPGLNDHELESLLQAAYQAGAKGAGYTLLRLPGAVEVLFVEWLEKQMPDRKNHILSLLKQCREGALYQNQFGTRMIGTGPYAQLLKNRFQLACKRLGFFERKNNLDCSLFQPPPQISNKKQLSLNGFEQ